MYKKARKKIVIVILSILAAVIIGTLGMIYLTSYMSLTSSNYRTLEMHVQMLNENSNINIKGELDDYANPKFDSGKSLDDGRHQGKAKRDLELNIFYTAKLTDDGTWQVIENGAAALHSDEELVELAESVSDGTKGKIDNLLYYVSNSGENKMVCFMDNARFADNFTYLLSFTLLFGVIALIIFAFISIYLARRIVSPMEESYTKQRQFTADAGHELKTPIAAMATNIEILKREIGNNSWLDNIAYENERMRILVTELLELARNENKKAERKPTDLSVLVNGEILPLEATAFEKNVLIESEINENIVANVDENSTKQLVTILIDNAISHSVSEDDKTKKVYVNLSKNNSQAVLSVSNFGEEIPEKEREKLFERFYRTDQSHEFSGHYGLGLAIAKAIADANDAKIKVECENGMVIFKVFFSSR